MICDEEYYYTPGSPEAEAARLADDGCPHEGPLPYGECLLCFSMWNQWWFVGPVCVSHCLDCHTEGWDTHAAVDL